MILYASMSGDEAKVIQFYLETFKIACSYRDLDKDDQEKAKEDLVSQNPVGIFPCLQDSDTIIFGVVPVLLYIAEEYANFTMCGSTIESRCKIERVLMWAASSLSRSVYHNFTAPRLFESHSIGEFQNMSLVTHGKEEIIEHFDVIEKVYLTNSKNAYLVNNELSMADVYVATTISALESLFFDFSSWPLLCKWFERVKTDMTKTAHDNKLKTMLNRVRVL